MVRICAARCHSFHVSNNAFCRSDLSQTEVENFYLAARGDEDVCGLNVAMNDAFCMSDIESISDFDGQIEEMFRL
jgi:hypothetical protein